MKEWIIPHAVGGFYNGKEVMYAVGPLLDGPLPNPGHTIVIEKIAYDQAQEELGKQDIEIQILKSYIRFLLPFAPRGPVPKGLNPMFYHTLNYETEVELQNKIDTIITEIGL